MIRHNRLLVAFHVVSDALLGVSAFVIAYAIRFYAGLIPITRGLPPFQQYVNIVPFVAVLVPLGFHLQGLYRLRRGRSRVDDFFAVFVGTILAVVFGIVPLEAQACGRPVVALGRGGALETVVPGETGLLVNEPGPEAFADAIAIALDRTFDSRAIRRHAERFSRERFGDEMEALVRQYSEAAAR